MTPERRERIAAALFALSDEIEAEARALAAEGRGREADDAASDARAAYRVGLAYDTKNDTGEDDESVSMVGSVFAIGAAPARLRPRIRETIAGALEGAPRKELA